MTEILTLMSCPACKATLLLTDRPDNQLKLICTDDNNCGWSRKAEGVLKYVFDKREITRKDIITQLSYFESGWVLFQEFYETNSPDILITDATLLTLDSPIYLYTAPPTFDN